MNIEQIIIKNNLEEEKAVTIREQFAEFASIASEWESKAKEIVVTDINQKEEMKLAREGRLILKSKRVEIEKRRKSLKESALREGQTIDAIAKALKELIEPIENYLDDQEKFAERMEAEQKAKQTQERLLKLSDYSENDQYTDKSIIENMDNETFDIYLSGIIKKKNDRIEAEQKAEKERIAKEKAEAEERERIRLENLKLKEEAEAREKELAIERAKVEAEKKEAELKARKEREEIEAKLRAEAEAKAKLEAEIRAKEEAEKRAIQEKQERELKEKEDLAKASDSKKIAQFISQLQSLEYPEMKSKKWSNLVIEAQNTINRLIEVLKCN